MQYNSDMLCGIKFCVLEYARLFFLCVQKVVCMICLENVFKISYKQRERRLKMET